MQVKSEFLVILGILWHLILLPSYEATHCDRDGIATCLNPVLSGQPHPNDVDDIIRAVTRLAVISKVFVTANIRNACIQKTTMETCLRDALSVCQEPSYNSETFEEELRNLIVLLGVLCSGVSSALGAVAPDDYSCIDSMPHSLDYYCDVTYPANHGGNMAEEICRAMEEYQECLYRTVESYCSAELAEQYVRLWKTATQDVYEMFGCDDKEVDLTVLFTVVGVGGLLFVGLSIGCACYWHHRCKRRMVPTAVPLQQGAPPYPSHPQPGGHPHPSAPPPHMSYPPPYPTQTNPTPTYPPGTLAPQPLNYFTDSSNVSPPQAAHYTNPAHP